MPGDSVLLGALGSGLAAVHESLLADLADLAEPAAMPATATAGLG